MIFQSLRSNEDEKVEGEVATRRGQGLSGINMFSK
jgi:hypothetical protein